MKKNLLFLSIAVLSLLMVGCNEPEQQAGEAFIKSISIKGTTCQGTEGSGRNETIRFACR